MRLGLGLGIGRLAGLGPELIDPDIDGAGWTNRGSMASASGDQVTFVAQFDVWTANLSGFPSGAAAGQQYRFAFSARRISGNTTLHVGNEGWAHAAGALPVVLTGSVQAFVFTLTNADYFGVAFPGLQDRNAAGFGIVELLSPSLRKILA